jgi:hypothetical protein
MEWKWKWKRTSGNPGRLGRTGKSGERVEKRNPTRERKAHKEWYPANMAAEGKETRPQTYKEALAGADA